MKIPGLRAASAWQAFRSCFSDSPCSRRPPCQHSRPSMACRNALARRAVKGRHEARSCETLLASRAHEALAAVQGAAGRKVPGGQAVGFRRGRWPRMSSPAGLRCGHRRRSACRGGARPQETRVSMGSWCLRRREPPRATAPPCHVDVADSSDAAALAFAAQASGSSTHPKKQFSTHVCWHMA